MLLKTRGLEFGEFLLDLEERVLLRNGERLPINPKTFQLLVVLAENHGRVVEKERLMETLWADSFVEDANLAFTVSLLRKALGDDAHSPRYVETVPRRGYRFVADVRERFENADRGNPSQSNELKTVHSPWPRRAFATAAAALAAIGTIVGGLWYAGGKRFQVNAPILEAKFAAEKLSTDGNVRNAVVSPDGKFAVYTNGTNEKQSVWIRQLESSSNVQIIPPADVFYYELALSPDGQTLYFARVQNGLADGQKADIYRVPVLGGVPEKIIGGTEGSVSVSPDGTKISYRRCPYLEEEYCSLWIADSDGGNEKSLLSRPFPIRIGDNAIAPDAKSIAFAVGQSRNWANEFSLAEVDIATGEQHEITSEKFFNIKQLVWLPDRRGLLITAKKFPDNSFRIWHVSLPGGEARPLTNDSDDYASMSLSRDATVLVSTKSRADYRLKVYALGNFDTQPRGLAEASSVNFAPNGKIVFSSDKTGNHEIWIANADGSELRQLTNHPAIDLNGVPSPDSKFVFFESNRSGESQIWRMNADGTDQRQLTFEQGGYPQMVSPDGKWLYYLSARDRKLMRVPTDGGGVELIWDRLNHHAAVSPDTSRVAFSESREKQTVITIRSIAEKQTIRTFEIPGDKTGIIQSAWSSDGSSLYYVAPADKPENYFIWLQPLDGKERIPVADLGQEGLRELRSFAVSPSGNGFAVIQGSWKNDAILLRGLR